jgi:hypothetical protein
LGGRTIWQNGFYAAFFKSLGSGFAAATRRSFGSQPVLLTARSAKAARSRFLSFSVAGAMPLPVYGELPNLA